MHCRALLNASVRWERASLPSFVNLSRQEALRGGRGQQHIKMNDFCGYCVRQTQGNVFVEEGRAGHFLLSVGGNGTGSAKK